jgi:hypothetical protein
MSYNTFLPFYKVNLLDSDMLTFKGSRSWEFDIQLSSSGSVSECTVLGVWEKAIGKEK